MNSSLIKYSKPNIRIKINPKWRIKLEHQEFIVFHWETMQFLSLHAFFIFTWPFPYPIDCRQILKYQRLYFSNSFKYTKKQLIYSFLFIWLKGRFCIVNLFLFTCLKRFSFSVKKRFFSLKLISIVQNFLFFTLLEIYRVSRETWQLVNSLKCLLPWVLSCLILKRVIKNSIWQSYYRKLILKLNIF